MLLFEGDDRKVDVSLRDVVREISKSIHRDMSDHLKDEAIVKPGGAGVGEVVVADHAARIDYPRRQRCDGVVCSVFGSADPRGGDRLCRKPSALAEHCVRR